MPICPRPCELERKNAMRTTLVLPVLLLALACSSKLDRRKAEDLLRPHYPVVVPVTIPEQGSAEKGSPAHMRLTTLKENLEKSGWFDCSVEAKGTQETFTFRLKPNAPKAIKAAPKGFSVPAAEAAFVRATTMETTREGARVTYEIRLEKPTAQFPLFQAMHQEVQIGQTKLRHATFERKNGAWFPANTDEVFRKVE
jgi:hypothetical protein